MPSASQRIVQLDDGGELVPRGRGELQLRAEELALGVEHLELCGESPFVARVKRFCVFCSSSGPVREQTPPFRASGFALRAGDAVACVRARANERSAANAQDLGLDYLRVRLNSPPENPPRRRRVRTVRITCGGANRQQGSMVASRDHLPSIWSARGVLTAARTDGRLECRACAHACLLRDGQTGRCGVRHRDGGDLLVPFGYVAERRIRPIETNTVYHVRPGTLWEVARHPQWVFQERVTPRVDSGDPRSTQGCREWSKAVIKTS